MTSPVRTLRIGDRVLGPGKPTLVIAEIGVNHDGLEQRALELVRIAADCGADAIKLQIFRASRLVHGSAAFAGYQKKRCEDATPQDMLRRYELSTRSVVRVVELAAKLGILPLATPFSLGDVASLRRVDIPAVKIASPDVVNLPLLSAVAKLGRPMLLSTGAAVMAEIARTVGWMRKLGNPFCLLHCISSYPVAAKSAHLRWIGELTDTFGVQVGYSDHTTEPMAGALAVAAGAVLIERHLTFDRAAPGPDHAASSDPVQFAQYVRAIRTADAMRGAGSKRVLPIERDVRRVSRQSLVLRRGLRRGQMIRTSDLTVQRPGIGIAAGEIERVVGSRVNADYPPDTMLQWSMLASGAGQADAA